MGQPISAEDHNRTRREVKARRAKRRQAGERGQSGVSILEAAARDKIRRQQRIRKATANGKRLLALVDKQGVLTLTRPNEDYYVDPYENYETVNRQYENNRNDLITASQAFPGRYYWEENTKRFIIGVKKRQK